MGSNRRQFLRIAGVTTLLGLGGGITLSASSYQPEEYSVREKEERLQAGRWGMVMDMRKFPEDEKERQQVFDKMSEACHSIHNVPEHVAKSKQEIKWIWADHFEHVFPGKENPFLAERLEQTEFPLLCNHCKNPPCVRVCPTQATFQREDGIVMMDFHRCIGCRYCMAACPYGSRSFNFCDPAPYVKDKNPDFPLRMRGVVEKCLFCYERLEVGEQPACVEVSNGAIIFGDLDDPNSYIREVLRKNHTIRRKVDLGTEPSVFYIV